MKRNEFDSLRREIFEGANHNEKHLLILENITNSALYEAKQISFFGKLFSWFKRNFSSKSIKIRELVKEYVEYLTKEYNANYVAGEKSLRDFFNSVEISSDMKDRIYAVAGKSTEYRELADELILEAQIRVKKLFAEKIEGKDGKTFLQLTQELENSKKKVRGAEEKASKDVIEDFTTAVKQSAVILGKTIGVDLGKDLASSLSIYLNNLKTKGEKIDVSAENIVKASEPFIEALKRIDPDGRKNALEHFRTLLTDKTSVVYTGTLDKKVLEDSYKKYKGTLQSKAKTYPNVFEEGGEMLEKMLFSLESDKGMDLLDRLGLIEDSAKRSEYLSKISEMLENTENDPEIRDQKTNEWIKFLENASKEDVETSKEENKEEKKEAQKESPKEAPENEKDDVEIQEIFSELPRIVERAAKDMIQTLASGKISDSGKIIFDSTHKYTETANLVKRPSFSVNEDYIAHAKKLQETPDLFSEAKIALVQNTKNVIEAIKKERGFSVLKNIIKTEESMRSLVLKVFFTSGLDTQAATDLEKFKKLVSTV